MRSANPADRKISPRVNLPGLDGSRFPSRSHIHAKTGARRMMKAAFTDWNQLDGKSNPRIEVRVLRSAKRLSVEPACSNADQNTEAPRKSTRITTCRFR